MATQDGTAGTTHFLEGPGNARKVADSSCTGTVVARGADFIITLEVSRSLTCFGGTEGLELTGTPETWAMELVSPDVTGFRGEGQLALPTWLVGGEGGTAAARCLPSPHSNAPS